MRTTKYKEDTILKQIKVPKSGIDNVNKLMLCYEILAQVDGLIYHSLNNAITSNLDVALREIREMDLPLRANTKVKLSTL